MQSFSTGMREEGKQIGIQLGEATVLLFQLEQNFGPIPEETRQHIEQAKPDILLRWSRRVLTQDSIEDVLR